MTERDDKDTTIITNIENGYYSPENIYIGGELVSIFLIILLIIAFLISETKYWNMQTEYSLETYSNPLLLVFIAIVAYKILVIIK